MYRHKERLLIAGPTSRQLAELAAAHAALAAECARFAEMSEAKGRPNSSP